MAQIRKILALTKSPEPGEAQAALERLQEIMSRYGITPSEVQAAEMEAAREPHRNKTVSDFESALLNVILDFYGCGILLDHSTPGRTVLHFYGRAPMPEISRYAWKFLSRRLREDRAAFGKSLNKRLSQSNRNAQLNLYSRAWVTIIRNKLEKLHPFPGLSQDEKSAYLSAWVQSQGLEVSEARTRNAPGSGAKLTKKNQNAFFAGMADASEVELNRPLSTPVKGQLQ